MAANLMKAVRQHEFGGPEVLMYEDAPRPELQTGEVLVKVRAVGINPPDWYLRDGFRSLPPEWQPAGNFPLILGTDVSGVIEAVAEDVQEFFPGEEVYSMVRFPEGVFGDSRAYAQYVSVPASQIARKPEGIDDAHATAAPMSLLTAWQFLVDLGHDEPNPLQSGPHRPVPIEGKTVVINGAAGGVGHYALQVAKHKGARVIAVASTRHEALLRDLGADEYVDYTRTSPEDVLKDVDLVFDTVGGAGAARFLKTLKHGGALFLAYPMGFAAGEEAERLGITVSTVQVRSSGAQLAELALLLADGTIRSVIDSSYPLADAGKAHARAAQGHMQGKIVLTVD